MKIFSTKEEIGELLAGRQSFRPSNKLVTVVKEIIERVSKEGDAAICDYTREFDKCELNPRSIRVTKKTIQAAECPKELEKAIERAVVSIRAFHEHQLRSPWKAEGPFGGLFGEIYRPVERAGVYVPGGTAPLVSSVLMSVVPAMVAGVKNICVATPCNSDGEVNSGILAACRILGVTEIYRGHGPSLVAALCLGTKAIPKVDVIAGPGSAAVTEMKRQLFGIVSVDLIAGPSESLIIADDSADPSLVAADIMSQAEHHGSTTYVVTLSKSMAESVKGEIEKFSRGVLSGAVEQEGLERLNILVASSLEEACSISNTIAPEHLQVMVEDEESALAMLNNAGAIFLGPWTPVPMGDFAFGPSHVLPTGCAARFMSGLSTATFMKRMSVMRSDREAYKAMADTIETFSKYECLPAHGFTSKIRRER